MFGATVPDTGGISPPWELPPFLLKLPQFFREHSAGSFPDCPEERVGKEVSLLEVFKQTWGWFRGKVSCASILWVYTLQTETSFEDITVPG